MSNLPDRPNEDDDDEPTNPFAGTPLEGLFGALGSAAPGGLDLNSLGLGDPASMQAMFTQLQRMFAPHEGAVNWDAAREIARQVVAQQPDRSPDAGDGSRIADAARLAEHWLDSATSFPQTSSAVQAWSRAQWVEASMPAWRRLVEPIAESVVSAMTRAIPAEAGVAGPMMGMLNQIGGVLFSQQIGQAVGVLSREVVSAADVGFPVVGDGRPAILPTNAAEFGQGLSIDESDVLLYLVLRECAAQRLYSYAPWLREHLFGLIEEYGRGITIDISSIRSKMEGFDPTNPSAMQEALTGGMFDLEQSPAQQAALTRLETTLALVEGWVDDVVGQAADAVMPHAQALREAVRRRRATGGPAEQTFAALVGLELRPRRLRDAAALWGALRSAEGSEARDGIWAHPDLLPTAADLDDPLAFAHRAKAADSLDVMSEEFDAQLRALLDNPADGATDGTGAAKTEAGTTGSPTPDTDDPEDATHEDTGDNPASGSDGPESGRADEH